MIAMISQPMSNLDDETIKSIRMRAVEYLEQCGYTVCDTYFEEYPSSDTMEYCYKNPSLWYLSHSLMKMSGCDAVYFLKGWEQKRGCRIEHAAAVAYGLDCIYEN